MAKKPKILLIEDEQHLVDMYRTQFESQGFSIEFSLTAKEGFDKAKEMHPDIILLDLILPTEDEPADVYHRTGYELLKKFKKDKDLKKIPVVILTNLDSKQERETSEELGAADYWVKAQKLPKEVVEGAAAIMEGKKPPESKK